MAKRGLRPILDLESRSEQLKYYRYIVGVDESGRGSLAGPIVIAAVMLPFGFQNPLIQDSKAISDTRRREAYHLIVENALEFKTIVKHVDEIEAKNPSIATQQGMIEIIQKFEHIPDICLIDGKEKITVPGIKTINVVAGDSQSVNIAAASILAKVIRDNIMIQLHSHYQEYNWDQNKGYCQVSHLISLFRYGICKLHRKNYEPIKSLIKIKSYHDLQKLKGKYGIT